MVFLMFWSLVCCIGYAILLAVPISKPGVQYFAVFITTMAVGPLIARRYLHCYRPRRRDPFQWPFCLIASADTSRIERRDKKAIGMGLVFSAGNSGGIVSSQAYRNKDAPR
jgi:hypothetical protein